ncbi:kinase-like domain-containing protein [Fomitopsis serialis]|uniref:kinase-like domain-containing protein n=1 Tax=Fomitopsis serialis TaxID=139415 RepID=UPI0020088777|nr:kinase-like domain-containing protein [Neoantrodia serialis]KAH9926471.1 kinase-like domain-containing protein [Neoantrodia serialis]
MAEYISETFPASKLGEYTVIEEIAEGTFGKVKSEYRSSVIAVDWTEWVVPVALHTITGHKVAMKFISKQVIAATKTKNRVQREVEYMRMLRHPHIIKLYEVISTPTDIIIVLEYAGGELFNYIVEHGRMPEHKARRFFQQIISGIDYSHHLKIVHRDLKPENVLLDADQNVKIADFGLSNEIKDGDFLKTSCGSPNYAAPEVIRGGLYTGPEIDVWSCGVILYVMLCGRLPFEDEDVTSLFTKISQGVYTMPIHLSPDAQSLISRMLAVDPVKRITVPEILQHPFYKTELPRYLQPLPPKPAVLPTLASLVTPPVKALDFEIIDGLGRVEEDVVDELTARMEGVDKEDVWESLRRDDGPQGNAVKPRNLLSPSALSPGPPDLEENPFDNEFGGYDEDDMDDGLDFSTPQEAEVNNFAVLNSSLPDQLPEQHHLASYASAKRLPFKEKKQHRTKWHFGIRSRSPPMEVMLEIYRTLKTIGMEWKAKKDLGGLGGAHIERNRELDSPHYVDLRAASSIYFIESRARVQDVVVLMNLQLYMVDSINYLVDFHHKKTYTAETASLESSRSLKEINIKEDEVVSPFVFMDVACRLILELAGGGE